MQACFQGLWLNNVGRVYWGGVEKLWLEYKEV